MLVASIEANEKTRRVAIGAPIAVASAPIAPAANHAAKSC
jgi:hypothetical protein